MIDKRVFVGGMDTDTDDRLIAQGDYRRAVNLRITSSRGDNVGTAEVARGNELITSFLPSGRNKTIGVHRSEQRDSIIYFVWNSNRFHSIYEYKALSGTITTVLQNSILNFREFSRITGTGDTEGLLLWTDDFNPPRRINIEKAILHTQSGGTNPLGYGIGLIQGSTLEREKYINAIKAQPTNAPLIGFFTDPTRTTNRVRGKFLRFRYRYIYDDGDKSAWSEPSVLGYTVSDFIGNSGDIVFSPLSSTTNFVEAQRFLNGVRLTMDSSHETVVGYEVSVARGYDDFFLWREFGKEELSLDDDVPFTVEYFGDSVLTPLEINDSISPFDDVPLKAKALALIEGNRVTYGNVVKGYDPVAINVSMNAEYYNFDPFSEEDLEFGNEMNLNNFPFETVVEGVGEVVGEPPFGTTQSVTYRGRRRVISEEQFRNLLISNGYELEENSLVQINFSLGASESPNANEEDGLIPVSLAIPPLAGTPYVDEYAYLYDVLYNGFVLPTLNGAVEDYESVFETLFTAPFYAGRVNAAWQLSGVAQNNRFRFFDAIDFASDFNTVFPVETFENPLFNDGYFLFEQTNSFDAAVRGTRGVYSFSLRSIPLSGDTFTTFKSGSTHRFALVYFDAYGRSGFANANEACEVYVDAISERDITQGTLEKLRAKINWRINHQPPSWATHYAWVYAGNDRTDDFLWLPMLAPSNESGIVTGVPFVSADGSAYNLSIWRLQQFQNESAGDTSLTYSYANGDRMQFVGQPPILADRTRRWRNGDVIDVPVLREQNANGEVLLAVPNFGDSQGTGVRGSLVELYRPKPDVGEGERVYYTISEKYPIANGQHTVTQGSFERGDVYLRTRVYASPTPADGVSETQNPVYETYVVESPSIVDTTFSRFYDRGKAFTVDNRQGQARYIDQVTWSESLVIGSRINGLSKFNPVELPFKEYGRVYGAIQRLFAVDNRLEIYQEDKVQYSLVSRDVIYDNGGGASILGTLSNVLSDAVAYAGEYGVSNNPESWAVFGNRRYFVDRKRGVVCRLSADGIEVISDNKMLSYFRDGLQNSLVTYFDGAVYGGYDARYSEYVVSIERRERTVGEVILSDLQGTPPLISVVFDADNLPDLPVGGVWEFFYIGVDGNTYSFIVDPRFPISITETDEGLVYSFRPMGRPLIQAQVGGEGWFLKTVAETLAFNENTKRWTTFYTFEPEFMMRVFNELCSFKNGRFYLHGNGADCEFYGEVTAPELWVVSNAQPSLQKFFRAVSIEGDMLYVPYLIETPLGQRSELIATDFSLKEGFYYSELFRDLNTPSDTTEGETLPNALFEGDMLRDYAITLRMRGELGIGREVFAVNVVFEVSFLAAQEG